jgi:hypothetical protein
MPKREDVSTEETKEGIGVTPQAVANGVVPDIWTEECLVSIATPGKGELLFEAKTESVDIDLGEKPVEFVPILNGGRLTKFEPMEDSTITMECYFVGVGSGTWPAAATSVDGDGMFDLFQAEYTTKPYTITLSSVTRTMVRITLLWTDQATVTGGAALGTVLTASTGLRMSFADGFITSIKPVMNADDGLKFTIVAKFPAVDSSGNGCCRVYDCDSTAQLPALSAYTTTTKF